MTGSMWLVFIVACVGFGLWEVIKAKTEPKAAGPKSEDAFPGARPGKTPHPAAYLVDMPGGAMRLIDLRGLPIDDLQLAKVDVVREQLRLERPVAYQIWVVDVETARQWSALGVALVIVAGRINDPRCPEAKNLLYTVGGKLTDAETALLKEGGIEIVLSMTNLSNPPKEIEDFLTTPPRWAPSPDDRPVPPFDVISTGPFDGELVHIIQGFAYVDLRRVVPGAWTNGVGIERLEKAVRALRDTKSLTHVVWVAAPWVLELVPQEQISRIETLVLGIAAPIEQRLAVVTPEGEPVGDHALLRVLGKRLPPIAEKLSWRTQDRGAFEVRPIDSLHDAYFTQAWKHPRL